MPRIGPAARWRLAALPCLALSLVMTGIACSSPTAPELQAGPNRPGVSAPAGAVEPWELPQEWVDLVVFTYFDREGQAHRKVLERFSDDVPIAISGPASDELRAAAAAFSARTGRQVRFEADGGTIRIVAGRRLASGAWAIYCHRYDAPAYTAADLVLGDGGPAAMRADVHEFGHALGLEHSDRAGIDGMAADGPRAFSALELRALEVMYRHRQPGDTE